MRRIAVAAVVAVSSLGVFSGTAGADPVVTACGSVSVTVNGEAVVNEAQCQVLPPA